MKKEWCENSLVFQPKNKNFAKSKKNYEIDRKFY